MLAADGLEAPPYMKQWEKELGVRSNKVTLEKMMRLAHTSAVDSNTAEMKYKCLSRWYRTPDKVSRYQRNHHSVGGVVKSWGQWPIYGGPKMIGGR